MAFGSSQLLRYAHTHGPLRYFVEAQYAERPKVEIQIVDFKM
jgi:hypothetical protein